MEEILKFKNQILDLCGKMMDSKDEEAIITDLKQVLESVKEKQYNNCSVELFEALLDEELVLDLLIKNNTLDLDTAKELLDNRESYLKGEYFCKKLIDTLI
ncbi:hypothetical protein [uncultured Clostridium sp.]|uniref:hypothetical protein n=1 Tax=uncultured Clostridium sp. TaxID=59620 RepID=UPI002627875B|nr:hypothetical protein [uncultured Clostridium sp.]